MERALSQFDNVVPLTSPMGIPVSWRATESLTNRTVVIRRLDASTAKTRATQTLSLNHAGIVPSRRWIKDGGYLYVIRDFVAGNTISDTLRDSTSRAFDLLRRLFDPVLDAIEFAHSFGIVHGHLTESNIIVTTAGPIITDFAAAGQSTTDNSQKSAQPTTDLKAVCQLYKNYLADAPPDDEARMAARTRLLRNLSEMQQSASTADELRYKLDAITRMAELLGFASTALPRVTAVPAARLAITIEPTTASIVTGSGATVILALDNTGDTPLLIKSVESSVVWLNLHGRFEPVNLVPDQGCDLLYTVSGARLGPGTYDAKLIVHTVSGTGANALDDTQTVSLPVIVTQKGVGPTQPRPPLAVGMSGSGTVRPTQHTSFSPRPEQAGLACTQEPDPALVIQGQLGVMHLGVTNSTGSALRVDKIQTHPNWLQYPGELRPTTIDNSGTQYFGFSVVSSALTPGDYKATVKLTTSTIAKNDIGTHTSWRETPFDVRIRIIRGAAQPLSSASSRSGCLPVLGTLIVFWVVCSAAVVGSIMHYCR